MDTSSCVASTEDENNAKEMNLSKHASKTNMKFIARAAENAV